MDKDSGEVVARTSVRLCGLGVAAKALGVHRKHLRLVVLGERPSAALLERVREQFPALLAPGGKTWKEAGLQV